MKKRLKLSFSKAEMKRAQVQLGNAGIMLAMPSDKEDANKFMQSFGFFGGSGDGNKFYPDLNVQQDLMPKEEDFVNVPFRMLSATVVAAGTWRSTDFTDAEVLRRAVKKLANKPVYKEHDTDLDNWVGLVKNPKFSPAFTMNDGMKIPAGIDAIISIDGKTNPKIARAVLVGGIYSNSVTVEFDWEPSHIFEGENAEHEFERSIGKIIDGRMVCRKVTEIIDFYESSLVWLGADPYAKKISESGDLINVDESSTYEDEVVQTRYKKESKYEANLALSKNLLSLSKNSSFNNTNPKKEEDMKPELVLALKAILGLAADAEITKENIDTLAVKSTDTTDAVAEELATAVSELTGEKVEASLGSKALISKFAGHKAVKSEELTALTAAKGEVESLKNEKTALAAEVGTLKADKATLEAKVTELSPKAALGDKFVADKRTECERLYNISVDNKPIESVLNLIKKATVEELDGLIAQYTKGVTQSFTGKCKDCGSTSFEFKSSVAGEVTGDGKSKDLGTDFQSIHEKFDNKNLNIINH